MFRPCSRARRVGGFTLLEVLMAVVLVGILASIALPAYSEYVRRGRLPEAFQALAEYHAKMEQYFQDHQSYGSGGACATDPSAASWNRFVPRGAKHFNYVCTATASPSRYVVTATGADGSTLGFAFAIDQNGDRFTTLFNGSPVTADCWLTRQATC